MESANGGIMSVCPLPWFLWKLLYRFR